MEMYKVNSWIDMSTLKMNNMHSYICELHNFIT